MSVRASRWEAAMTTRRDFLKSTAAIGGAMGLAPLARATAEPNPSLAEEPAPPAERAAAPLNILILGGTGFTGPEQVEYAIARGHRVTLFNRGKTRPGTVSYTHLTLPTSDL